MKMKNKFALPLNLQFFAEGEGDNGAGSGNEPNNNGDSSAGTQKTDNTIPYERFKEVNDNYKAVKQQLDELLKAQKKQDEDTKKKQGEFEELYNNLSKEHEPLKKQFDSYQNAFKEMLKTKKESIPEEFQDLVPKGMDEVELIQWIDNAQSKGLFEKQKVSDFGNKGSNPNNEPKTPENLGEAIAQKYKNLFN